MFGLNATLLKFLYIVVFTFTLLTDFSPPCYICGVAKNDWSTIFFYSFLTWYITAKYWVQLFCQLIFGKLSQVLYFFLELITVFS